MIKKFNEFIIESNEQYILSIKLSENDPKLKENIERIYCSFDSIINSLNFLIIFFFINFFVIFYL